MLGESIKGNAMRPAPPEVVNRKIGDYKIISIPKQSTKVLESKLLKDKIVWEFDEYIGQKIIFLSPDGKTMVLFGSDPFGSIIRTDESTKILEIRSSDGNHISFTYKEITDRNLDDDIEKNAIFPMGGGWVGTEKLLNLETVDWDNKNIKFRELEKKW